MSFHLLEFQLECGDLIVRYATFVSRKCWLVWLRKCQVSMHMACFIVMWVCMSECLGAFCLFYAPYMVVATALCNLVMMYALCVVFVLLVFSSLGMSYFI